MSNIGMFMCVVCCVVHSILDNFLGSETESGVHFSIRPNPGSKNWKFFRKVSKSSKIGNFLNWVCSTCFNVKLVVLRTIPGFFSRLDVTLT